MNRANWPDIERVLATVIDLPEAERTARIEELCCDNAELRAEVESLLAANDRASTYLEEGLQLAPELKSPFSFTGKQLGPYLLLERIGSGGMGTVYLAERSDGRFQKQVAVKVAPAALHSPELLRRFSAEQQILANLEHANIARLLDAGVSLEGLPYFVMEFVEGKAIDEYCAALQLSARQCLALFQSVCSAVSYAHQHLVVHRDIKPGNILVTADGTPKLLDFGIAKIIDQWRDSASEGTHSVLNPMTPDYASPEQARGETITTATDIYSLGVVLYELLAGQRPYEVAGKPLNEALRIISEFDPEKPSTVLRARRDLRHSNTGKLVEYSSDLDAIVAKAMRKEPQQRYASAHELAGDLSRYLKGMPVSAHRGSFRYLAAKFILRHKAAVFASISVLILAIAGVTAIVRQAKIAQQQREKAQRRFEQVRSLAKSLMFEVNDSIKDLPGTTPARKLIVSRALEYLDGLSQEAGGDLSLQRELASAYERVGDVQGFPYVANLGDGTGAVASYRKSLAIREPLFRADPGNPTLRAELSGTYWKTGICLDASSDYSGALANLRKALALTEETGHATTSEAVSDRLAGDHWAIARVLQETGNLLDALAEYQKAAAIRESTASPGGAPSRIVLTHLAGDYYGMAEVLKIQGQMDSAAEADRKSMKILQQLLKEDPENAPLRGYLASSYSLLGSCQETQGLPDQALDNYRKAQEIYNASAAADPTDALGERLVGYIEMQIGRTLVKKGEITPGLKTLHQALTVFQDLARKAPGSNYISYNFGNVYSEIAAAHVALATRTHLSSVAQQTEWKEARTWYQKSVDVWLEVQRQGKLGGDEIGEPDRLPKEIAKCDNALARLQALGAPLSKQ